MTPIQKRILLAAALFLMQRVAQAEAQSGGVGSGAGGAAQSGAPGLGLGHGGGLDTNGGAISTPEDYDKMGKSLPNEPDPQPTWPIPATGTGTMPGTDPRRSPERGSSEQNDGDGSGAPAGGQFGR
ncbi:MAG: hypothetical protein U0136_02950 [Bdellovibrionota bacterium]